MLKIDCVTIMISVVMLMLRTCLSELFCLQAPASKVEAVVWSPTNMAAAKIVAIDFNKMTSKWHHSFRQPACGHVCWGRSASQPTASNTSAVLIGCKKSREYLIHVCVCRCFNGTWDVCLRWMAALNDQQSSDISVAALQRSSVIQFLYVAITYWIKDQPSFGCLGKWN